MINPNYYSNGNGQDMFHEMRDNLRNCDEVGTLQEFMTLYKGFLAINVKKYLRRAGRKTKDSTEDFEKAKTYLAELKTQNEIYLDTLTKLTNDEIDELGSMLDYHTKG